MKNIFPKKKKIVNSYKSKLNNWRSYKFFKTKVFRDLGLKTAQSVGRGIQVPNMDLRLKEGSRRSEMGQGLAEVKGQPGAILKHPLYRRCNQSNRINSIPFG